MIFVIVHYFLYKREKGFMDNGFAEMIKGIYIFNMKNSMQTNNFDTKIWEIKTIVVNIFEQIYFRLLKLAK